MDVTNEHPVVFEKILSYLNEKKTAAAVALDLLAEKSQPQLKLRLFTGK
jgi:hypothetical protein